MSNELRRTVSLHRKLYAISEPGFEAGIEACVACSHEISVGFLVLMVRLRLCFLIPTHISSFLLDGSANSICVSVSVLPADRQDVPPLYQVVSSDDSNRGQLHPRVNLV
jgi:hypothetical protein